MSDVGSEKVSEYSRILTKNVKEIFCDLKFLSEVTGCRKTQVSNHTGSTVYNIYQNWMRQTEHTKIVF
jgi:hypothetical protein